MPYEVSAPHDPKPVLHGSRERTGLKAFLRALPVGKAITVTNPALPAKAIQMTVGATCRNLVKGEGGKFATNKAGDHSVQIKRIEAAKPTIQSVAA